MKRKLLVYTLLCFSFSVFSQDILTKKDGTEIQVKITEIGIDEVKYTRFGSTSPIYTLLKSEIFMIKYEDGSKELFDEANAAVPIGKQQALSTTPQYELSYNNGVYRNGTKLSSEQIKGIMAENYEALQIYRSGKTLSTVGQIIAYPCAFIFGYDVGTRIGGGEGNGALLGVGAAGTVIGLIMGFSGEKKIKTSVQLYNSGVNTKLSYKIDFGLTPTGVGLCMRF